MDYETMIDRVADYLDRTDLGLSTATTVSATKIGKWINDTRRDIALKYDFNYLYAEATLSTQANTAVYSLPSDYMGHLTIICDYKKLMRVGAREFDELEKTNDTENNSPQQLETSEGQVTPGFPEYYIDRGLYIELFPKPDDVYTLTLKYYALPASFTSDTDEDYMSRFHFESIIFGTSLRGAIFLDDTEKINIFKAAYDRSLSEIVAREKDKKQKDTHVRVKSWRDYEVESFRRMHRVKAS